MYKGKGVFCLFVVFTELALLCESRLVQVPVGPLVRVEGQSVSIRCNVSDYQGPRDQDFDWTLVLDSGKEIQLVSTFDHTFTDPTVTDRVNSGDISVKKLGDAIAELTIRKVRASDSATYRCSTPSTDSVISGNYNADVELKVIGDTLKVVPSIPQPSVSEGQSVELHCNATRAYTAHTFLSVTWSVIKGTNSLEELLTFGPGDEVKEAQGSAQRYTDGGLVLNLYGGGMYGLTLKGVKPEDQGTYVCTAREWTRQPGGGKSWQKILERSEQMGNVNVTPLAQSLMVSLEKSATLYVDNTLNLTCSVAADRLASLSLEVMWFVKAENASASQRLLLHVGRDGQVLSGSELVSSSRISSGAFRLLLPKVQLSDSGLYSCQVKAWLPQGSGSWYPAAEKTSVPVQVLVKQLDPEFNVSLTAPLTAKFTGEPTELLCQVTNLLNLQGGRLSVTWTYTENSMGDVSSTTSTIASLNEAGVLVPGPKYQKRIDRGEIALARSDANTFRLRLLFTQDADRGFYFCNVSAWTHGHQGGWSMAKERKSTSVSVQWTSDKPVLSVKAVRVREGSTVGSTFEMSCRVAAQNLQNPGYSVLIRLQKTQGGSSQNIMSLSPDMVVKQEDGMAASRKDSFVLEKTDQLEYRFRLHGAQVSDQGSYYCEVTAWTRDNSIDWVRSVSAESQKMDLAIVDTGPVFNVSIHSDSIRVLPGDTARMECIISVLGAKLNADDLSYEVRWFQSPARAMENGGATPVISMDRWGVVKKNGGNDSTECSLERTDGSRFVLSIHRAQDRDMGEYYCTAKPWYLKQGTLPWIESPELTSAPIFLSIRLALWDSLKIPVLYGLAAAFVVALLSVGLGIFTAHCCLSRNPMHTPRSKLMELEID